MAAPITLYLNNTATSSPKPTTSRFLVTSAPASEVQLGPGEFDSTLPGNTDAGQWNPSSAIVDTTAAAELDNTGASPGTTRQGWIYDTDLTGQVLVSGAWTIQLRLRANQGTGSTGRICARVSIVTAAGGLWTTVKQIFATTRITGEGSHSTGQNGWRDQNEARITVTSTAANFSTTIGAADSTTNSHTFASNERIFVELGFCDADSTTDRTWRLDYNTANCFITTPNIGAPPTVTAITPNTGYEGGGTQISDLAGTGFIATPSVTIGGVAASNVVFVSSTKLTAVTPSGSWGAARDVVVVNPDTLVGTGSALFTYNAPDVSTIFGSQLKALFRGQYSGGTWVDEVSHASTVDFTQPTVADRPTATTTPAGKLVLDADAAAAPNTDVLFGGAVGGLTAGGVRWMFFVLKPDAINLDGSDQRQILRCDNDDSIYITSLGKLLIVTAAAGTDAESNAALSTTDYTRVLIVTTSGNCKLYINDVLQTIEGVNFWAGGWAPIGGFFNVFELFSHNDLSRYDGKFGHLGFCYDATNPPTAQQRADLDDQLFAWINGKRLNTSANISISSTAKLAVTRALSTSTSVVLNSLAQLTLASSNPFTHYGANLAHWWFENFDGTNWLDNIGTADATQGTANKRPTADTTPPGRVSLVFDAVAGQEDTLATATGRTAGSAVACHIFGTFKPGISVNSQTLFTIEDSSNAIVLQAYLDTSNALRIRGVSAFNMITDAAPRTAGIYYDFVLEMRSTDQWELWINGVSVATDTTSFDTSAILAAFDQFHFGAYGSNAADNTGLCSWGIAYKATDFTTNSDALATSVIQQTYIAATTHTLNSSANVVFNSSATFSRIKNLSASANIIVSAVATLYHTKAISTFVSVALSTAADATKIRVITGFTTIVVDSSASVRLIRAPTASTNIVVTSIATLSRIKAVNASSNITVNSNAAITPTHGVSASATIIFNVVNSLGKINASRATTQIQLNSNANLGCIKNLAVATTVTLSSTAAAVVQNGAILQTAAAANIAISTSATSVVVKGLNTSSSVSFNVAASTNVNRGLHAQTTTVFNTTAALTITKVLSSNANLVISSNGFVSILRQITASSTVVINGTGTSSRLRSSAAVGTIAVNTIANIQRIRNVHINSNVTFSTAATISKFIALSGNASIIFNTINGLAPNPVTANAAITFNSLAALSVEKTINAATIIAISSSALLSRVAKFEANTVVAIASTATVSKLRNVSTTVSISLTTSAYAVVASVKAITASAILSLGCNANNSRLRSLSSSATVIVDAICSTPQLTKALSGSTLITLTNVGQPSLTVTLGSKSTLAFVSSATIQRNTTLTASSSIVVSTIGSLATIKTLSASSTLVINATASSNRLKRLTATADVSVNGFTTSTVIRGTSGSATIVFFAVYQPAPSTKALSGNATIKIIASHVRSLSATTNVNFNSNATLSLIVTTPVVVADANIIPPAFRRRGGSSAWRRRGSTEQIYSIRVEATLVNVNDEVLTESRRISGHQQRTFRTGQTIVRATFRDVETIESFKSTLPIVENDILIDEVVVLAPLQRPVVKQRPVIQKIEPEQTTTIKSPVVVVEATLINQKEGKRDEPIVITVERSENQGTSLSKQSTIKESKVDGPTIITVELSEGGGLLSKQSIWRLVKW